MSRVPVVLRGRVGNGLSLSLEDNFVERALFPVEAPVDWKGACDVRRIAFQFATSPTAHRGG